VLKANDEELAMLCGWYGCAAPASADVDELVSAACALRARLGLGLLLVTLGERGALAVDADRVWRSAAPRAARVVDTVGAGDSFSAVALAGFVRGWDHAVMLQRAGEFACRICEVRGAVPVELAAYAEWTRGWNESASHA